MAAAQEQPPLLRRFRPRKDALELYTDDELKRRYRLDRAGIKYVADMVRRDLQDPHEKLHSLTPETKVTLTLKARFFKHRVSFSERQSPRPG